MQYGTYSGDPPPTYQIAAGPLAGINGTIANVNICVGKTGTTVGGHIRVALYSGDGIPYPKVLLAESAEFVVPTIPADGTWISVPLVYPSSLGTDYWLAVKMEHSLSIAAWDRGPAWDTVYYTDTNDSVNYADPFNLIFSEVIGGVESYLNATDAGGFAPSGNGGILGNGVIEEGLS
jgi:hypothetical protein